MVLACVRERGEGQQAGKKVRRTGLRVLRVGARKFLRERLLPMTR